MRLLITGVSGMLGHSLARLACREHEVWGSYGSFPVSIPQVRVFGMDLTDERQVRERVSGLKPEAIIHCAALTDVDECERNPEKARRLNGQATRNLAMLARDLRARFIYISTDYVFDGVKGSYSESDAVGPVNVYAETKLFGEEAAKMCCADALILRTSIFGVSIQPKPGVVEYVVQCLKAGETIARFSDQFASPVYTGDLSYLVLELLSRGAAGLFHAGGAERISRYAFALKVADVFSLPQDRIQPVPFKYLEGLAKRPKDSSLCGAKLEGWVGRRLPHVEEGLRRLRDDLQVLKKER